MTARTLHAACDAFTGKSHNKIAFAKSGMGFGDSALFKSVGAPAKGGIALIDDREWAVGFVYLEKDRWHIEVTDPLPEKVAA